MITMLPLTWPLMQECGSPKTVAHFQQPTPDYTARSALNSETFTFLSYYVHFRDGTFETALPDGLHVRVRNSYPRNTRHAYTYDLSSHFMTGFWIVGDEETGRKLCFAAEMYTLAGFVGIWIDNG